LGRKTNNPDNLSKLNAVLSAPRPIGATLQDYALAHECVDWQLSRRFWEERGPAAFLSGDVPYVVTNDGHLAGNAVAVLLASCDEAAGNGTLEDSINLLELGAGSGLFAKQFLDQLRASDAVNAELVYDRLTYWVTDGSDAMIVAIQDHGLLADHKDHITCLPARAPGIAAMLGDAAPTGHFRAVYTNYLLDSLPFTILSLLDDQVHELRLRTSIAEDADLSQFTSLTEDEIVARFHRDCALDLEGLSDIFPALVIDGRYDRIDRADLPLGETIPRGPDREDGPRPYLHCFGALACIDEMLDLLRPDGFMLISDYGLAEIDPGSRAVEFQHFGGSVAVGLNFEAVNRVFNTPERGHVIAPESSPDHLLSRMITHAPAASAADVFKQRYAKANWDRLTKPLSEAQELVSNGQIEAARWAYRTALSLQPSNWAVLEEIAGFLCYHLEDYEGALHMAREALELNHISPGAWNVVGDCFFYTDNLTEASEAYEKARQVNPRDVRAVLNLAWVATHEDRPEEALTLIAKGLAMDVTGTFREALLGKQEQVLARQGKKYNDDLLRGMNRIRGHADLPGWVGSES
jgi:tetratricopeptide (TPR) repeat protein